MVTLARETRGYTQKKLAELIEISQGSMSKIEQGLCLVPDDVLEKLSKSLDFPIEFFFEPEYIYPPSSPFHRKRASLQKKIQAQIEAEANIRRIHINKLLKSAEIVDTKIIHEDIDNLGLSPAESASKIRYYWKLPKGPIENVTTVLENFGIIIAYCDFKSQLLDGFSFCVDDNHPIIFINSNAPNDRIRFTLSHEVGHIIMHRIPTPEMEKEANDFAAEFLMPSNEIKQHLYEPTLEKLAGLKRYWKVSIASLIYRAKSLKTITYNQERYLWTQYNAAGYRRKEPVELPKETPSIIQDLINLHLNDLGYSEEELSKILLSNTDTFVDLYMKKRLRVVKNYK